MFILSTETSMGMTQPNLDEISATLHTQIILNKLVSSEQVGNYQLMDYSDKNSQVKPWLIDLPIVNKTGNYLLTDMRPFVTEGGVKRMAARDYQYRHTRQVLTAIWMSGNQKRFLSDTAVAGATFVTMVTNRLNQVYQLDGFQLLMVRLISSIYYGQCHRKMPSTAEERQRDASTYMGYPLSESIIAWSDALDIPMYRISDYVHTMVEELKNPKFRNLTPATFMTHMRSMIYFYRSEVDIAIALEYPPVWVAMVHLVATDPSLKRTPLTAALSHTTKNKFDEFANQINVIMGDYS